MFFEFFKSEFEWKKTFIVATTVIALGSTMASGRETGQPKNLSRQILLESSSSPVMEYVELCRSGNDCKRFSRLVMGTDHLAQGQWTSDSQPEPDSTHVFNVLYDGSKSPL